MPLRVICLLADMSHHHPANKECHCRLVQHRTVHAGEGSHAAFMGDGPACWLVTPPSITQQEADNDHLRHRESRPCPAHKRRSHESNMVKLSLLRLAHFSLAKKICSLAADGVQFLETSIMPLDAICLRFNLYNDLFLTSTNCPSILANSPVCTLFEQTSLFANSHRTSCGQPCGQGWPF